MTKRKTTTFLELQQTQHSAVASAHCLTEEQAALLSEFYWALLDVVCCQVLPEAVKNTSVAGVKFYIQEQITDGRYDPKSGTCVLPTAAMFLKCDTDGISSGLVQDTPSVVSEQLESCLLNEFALPTRTHRRLALQLLMLARIYSEEGVKIAWEKQTSDVPVPAALVEAAADYTRVSVRVKLRRAEIEDLLAAWLADGLDLTALQPFLKC